MVWPRTCEENKAQFAALATRQDVAELLAITDVALRYHLCAKVPNSEHYTYFEIRKKSGGLRHITAPVGFWKTIQSRLLRILECVYQPKQVVHGFTTGRSILTNAQAHVARKWVLNVDIADFFPSINFGRVRGMFMAPPYQLPDQVSTVLAQICCVENELPQGSPTSPIVANMVCARLDAHMSQLARAHRCSYTRYADDLSVSTNQAKFPIELAQYIWVEGKSRCVPGSKLSRTIRKNGFNINLGKARLQKYTQRQEVTGLITNEHLNVRRTYIREIRAILHNMRTKGLDECQREYESKYAHRRQRNPKATTPPLRLILKGKIEYVGMVRKKEDKLHYRLVKELDSLIPNFVKVPILKDELEWLFDLVWLIESEDQQGTGFLLKGVGLVTAAHVVGKLANQIKAISGTGRVRNPTLVFRDDVRDVAIFDIGAPKDAGLEVSTLEPKLRLPILLLGFPNHNYGDAVQVHEGHVSGSRNDPTSSERLILLNAPVIFGNSGGPVLDLSYKVIGMALRGAANSVEGQSNEFHAAMPIAVVRSLV